MKIKDRWFQVRQWWAMRRRVWRLRRAEKLLAKLQCRPVGSEVLLQAVKKLAELQSFIEKSGEIRHRTQAYRKLLSRTTEISQLLEISVKVGDPEQTAQDLLDVYTRARWISMSRHQQKKYQQTVAAQAHRNLIKPLAPESVQAAT